jgi:hypothetical protein
LKFGESFVEVSGVDFICLFCFLVVDSAGHEARLRGLEAVCCLVLDLHVLLEIYFCLSKLTSMDSSIRCLGVEVVGVVQALIGKSQSGLEVWTVLHFRRNIYHSDACVVVGVVACLSHGCLVDCALVQLRVAWRLVKVAVISQVVEGAISVKAKHIGLSKSLFVLMQGLGRCLVQITISGRDPLFSNVYVVWFLTDRFRDQVEVWLLELVHLVKLADAHRLVHRLFELLLRILVKAFLGLLLHLTWIAGKNAVPLRLLIQAAETVGKGRSKGTRVHNRLELWLNQCFIHVYLQTLFEV